MSDVEKSCGNCKHADTYFGDCCHPDGGGCLDLHPSLENCLRKDRAWWELYVPAALKPKDPT